MNNFAPPKRLQGIEKSVIRQVFDRALPGSLNLGLGEPDLPTPDLIRKAAVKAIVEEQNGYTSHAGLTALREKVAGDYPYLEGRAERVIITAGSQEALYLALLTLVDEGDEVLLPDPGFVAYPTIVQMAGGNAKFYRMPREQGFAFDVDEFRRALTPRTKVVVCISPSNPTGRTLTNEDLAAIADALRDHGAHLISDEIYRELYYTRERPGSLSSFYDRTIVISGLSKSMSMTGWRLGWLCGDEDLLKAMLVLHGYVTTCASTVSQKASLVAWSDEAEAARAGFRETFRGRRDHLLGLIQSELGLRAVTPDGAFYVMLDVSEFGSSMKVAEALLEEKVITVPGAAFGSEGEGFLRVSFCAELEMLEEGVRRIKKAIHRLRRNISVKSVQSVVKKKFMNKYRVGILGATGMVGQRFIQLLENHPQFEITAVAASDRSQGKTYGEACTWRLHGEMPRAVRSLPVQPPAPPLDCDLVFSSLPGEIARETEGSFATAGYPVISNSSAFRMDEDVPLLIPEVNHQHLDLLTRQRQRYPSGGFIVTNPNCSTIMLVLALAPLHATFGIKSVVATTLQALSGAGYPGVASLDIIDNVLPHIGGEEEKIEIETTKILGRFVSDHIEPAPMVVSAQCHRVNVSDGHLAAVRVSFTRKPELEELREALNSFRSLPQELGLHSAPANPIVVRDEIDRPQPKLDRDAGNGMTVTVGRLKEDTVLDYRFVVLSHNTIRGAAGAAILNAELLDRMNKISK